MGRSRNNSHGEHEYECPICKNWYKREEMFFSRDCHGIPYRLVCDDCLTKIEMTLGFDGEYYTEADENIEEDY